MRADIPYSRLQRVTILDDDTRKTALQSALIRHTVQPFTEVMIPDAVIIQFVLLKMSMLMLETCRGL